MGARELASVFCIIAMLFCLHKILQNVSSMMVLKALATKYGKDTETVERLFENNIRQYVSRVDGIYADNVNVEVKEYRITDYMELNGLKAYISGDAKVSYMNGERKVKKEIGFRVDEETFDLNNMDLIIRMFD